ncbi:MAG: DUF5658 family protein [Bryobacteraceae bacterium]
MPLLAFICLQALDGLTTILFLGRGVAEGNPLVRAALHASQAGPALPLLAVKLAGVAVAFYAYRSGRLKMLRRINVLFALCIAWNLAAIVTASI